MKVELIWCEVDIYPAIDKTRLLPRELSIVTLRLEKKKWREIGVIHNISGARCTQIYNKALRKIGHVWQFGEKSKVHKDYHEL